MKNLKLFSALFYLTFSLLYSVTASTEEPCLRAKGRSCINSCSKTPAGPTRRACISECVQKQCGKDSLLKERFEEDPNRKIGGSCNECIRSILDHCAKACPQRDDTAAERACQNACGRRQCQRECGTN